MKPDFGPSLRAEDFNRFRVACLAVSWRLSRQQLLLLAEDFFDEAQSRVKPLERPAPPSSTIDMQA